MRFSEAMRLLEEGKKVRKNCWCRDGYIYKDEGGYINDEDEHTVDTAFFTVEDEWEEYIEEGMIKELDEEIFGNGSMESKVWRLFNKLSEVIREINRRNKDERI